MRKRDGDSRWLCEVSKYRGVPCSDKVSNGASQGPAESGGPGPESMRGKCANLVANPLSRFLTVPLPAHKVLGFLSLKDPPVVAACLLSFFSRLLAYCRMAQIRSRRSCQIKVWYSLCLERGGPAFTDFCLEDVCSSWSFMVRLDTGCRPIFAISPRPCTPHSWKA